VAEFRRQTEAIREAANEWAIRRQEQEGGFISALLGAMEIVGRLTASVHSAIDGSGARVERRPRLLIVFSPNLR
jgi:hypothetical protein